MKKRFLALAVPAAFTLSAAMPVQADTLDVVASFTVLADVVKNVGGDQVNVTSLVPANGDPHDFEPSPENARALKQADVTFLSGENLEIWFERLAEASGNTQTPVIVSDGIATHTFEEDGETIIDPHVWNSAANVLVWIDNIEQALVAAAPEDAAAIHQSADAYRQKIQALDADIKAKIDAVPEEARKVLTSHDAFGYYTAEYGVQFMSPLGVSTETEASAGEVARLIDQIKEEGVKVYFIESSNDGRLVEQIANATGAKSGGELYPEALSAADGVAPTYIELMNFNTSQILSAIAE
ncbi:metal ABC transporter solute-binding protein, Zn/Mn family [Marinobacterium mangrovicola]|uniref:Zinc/manganese transport system substrate-binding protein n=1 Tax=Marinobacterium mangrovicola TaxID=1476959 RepID=A0A4R1GJQ2_9GAMM|nr:zinc ABC transporter substrate-binding protein [Marinobacterium mangrovicola]TCK08534.1 zinc/manganese transport system substrate-binding protein [Marinobacterium mangrovicola]